MAKKQDRCEQISFLLDAYLDGELSPKQAARVKAHLDICPDCRALKVEQQALMRLLREQADEVEVPGTLLAGVMRSVHEQPREKAHGRVPLLLRRGLGISFACLLVFCMVIFAVPYLLSGGAMKDAANAPSLGAPAEDGDGNGGWNGNAGGSAAAPENNKGDTPNYGIPGDNDSSNPAPGGPSGDGEAPGSGGPSGGSGPNDGMGDTAETIYELIRVSGAPTSTGDPLDALHGAWKGERLALELDARTHEAQISLDGETMYAADVSLLRQDGAARLVLQLENGKQLSYWVLMKGEVLCLIKLS